MVKDKNGSKMKILLDCLGVIAGVFLFYGACKLVLRWRKSHSSKSKVWDVNFDRIFLPPLKLLSISLGIYLGIVFSGLDAKSDSLEQWLVSLRNFSILVAVSWAAYRWKKELCLKSWKPGPTMELVSKLFSIAFAIVFCLMALQIFHVDIVPLLAFGGIGAAALGFAAKDVLGNLFGGGMLSLTSPFRVGDFVLLPDRNLEGTVEEIGWYFTSIRDKDKRPIYFPNSLFSNVPVINLSRITYRRIYQRIHVAYRDFQKILEITASLRELLQKQTTVDLRAPFLIHLDAIGEYSLQIVVDFYTNVLETQNYVLVKEELLDLIFKELQRAGIQIVYPTSVFQGSISL